MCGIIPITEHYEEMAKAREEQREACARQLEATLSAYWPGQEREIQSAMNVVRAMSLDSTPLADRIRELEASRELQERNRELVRERDEARAFLRRTAMTGGSIVSSAAMTATQIAIARAADRMLVTPDGYGFVYIPGPRFCACGRVESDCDQSRASCPKADPASEGDDETDIIIAGRQVPFVQVGMIVHPDDCLNCERDGSPLWCSALVCDIHDDDETARFGMMATLLFRNGERREEPCDELRRRWRLARDFDQGRVYTGRWGAIPRGSVWPVAEVNEDA
jgi:hypothetical protein